MSGALVRPACQLARTARVLILGYSAFFLHMKSEMLHLPSPNCVGTVTTIVRKILPRSDGKIRKPLSSKEKKSRRKIWVSAVLKITLNILFWWPLPLPAKFSRNYSFHGEPNPWKTGLIPMKTAKWEAERHSHWNRKLIQANSDCSKLVEIFSSWA